MNQRLQLSSQNPHNHYFNSLKLANVSFRKEDFSIQLSSLLTITVLIHLNPATVSFQREKPSYICGLRARIECEPFSEHLTRSDRVTNIG